MTDHELTELENEVAQRDDSNAMHSACGEYNCDCHYNLPKVIAALRAERLRLRIAVEALSRECAPFSFPDEDRPICHDALRRLNENLTTKKNLVDSQT